MHCRALVVGRDTDRVRVGIVNPNDERACNFIRDVLNEFQVEFVAISEDDFDRHAPRLLGQAEQVDTSAPFAGKVTSDFTGMRSMMTKSSVSTFSPGATGRATP